MALTPLNEAHALQIQAGTLGRHTGHDFEDQITKKINGFKYPLSLEQLGPGHVFSGDPSKLLLHYIGSHLGLKVIRGATALSTGALATSESGKTWLSINGASVSRCKSDLIITLNAKKGQSTTLGISTKQCNNKTPTNAQLYFTTARGFAALLRRGGVDVSDRAVDALRQFCGDAGFRPQDVPANLVGRRTDPRRYFWEEIDTAGRAEWEDLLGARQAEVSRLLLQKAYIEDAFVPDFLIHKTRRASSWSKTEVAIYTIEELIALSRAYGNFSTRPYSVRKGSYKDPPGVSHLAPRFGIIQMQRGGQAQHPEQLQFNLEARYFYKIE